jgi:gamma-glutamyltranspeptidase
MGGPGGSSYYLVYRPQDGEVVALDASNLAPAAATAGGFTRGMLSEGVTSMGIPGTMAGYWMIVERYGRGALPKSPRPPWPTWKKVSR